MCKLQVSFWKKESQNLMSHGKGLTQDQVDALKELKVGDRLIIWKNDRKTDESHSDYALKVFEKREKEF